MPGPGEYRADRTEGITRVEDLSQAKVEVAIPNALPSRAGSAPERALPSKAV